VRKNFSWFSRSQVFLPKGTFVSQAMVLPNKREKSRVLITVLQLEFSIDVIPAPTH
jgi:hypothetical protein